MPTKWPAHSLMLWRARLMSRVTAFPLLPSWDSQASLRAAWNRRRVLFTCGLNSNKEDAVYRIIITPQPPLESCASSAERSVPARKLADAELQFEGPLSGLTLVGFAVWDNGEHGYRVSFPSRRYVGAQGQPRSFLLLRTIDPEDRTSSEGLRRDIVAAYEADQRAGTASAQEAA